MVKPGNPRIGVKRLASSMIAGLLVVTCLFSFSFVDVHSAAIAAPASATVLIAAGPGMVKQVEGKAQQAAGAVQQKVGEINASGKGLDNQVKGRAKEDIGRVQTAVEKAQGQVEQRADRDIKETQNALDKASAKVGEATAKAADAVQSLFQN
jgi:uncharacterized protein YjbJ (UPF0337 family)